MIGTARAVAFVPNGAPMNQCGGSSRFATAAIPEIDAFVTVAMLS